MTATRRMIMDATTTAFDVTVADICGQNRRPEYTVPRHTYCWLMHRLTNYSLPQIGQTIGGRDHTTVIHAIEKTADRIQNDPDFRTAVRQITNRITGSAPCRIIPTAIGRTLENLQRRANTSERIELLANAAIETGGYYSHPIAGDNTSCHPVEVCAHGLYASGDTDETAIRNWMCVAANHTNHGETEH